VKKDVLSIFLQEAAENLAILEENLMEVEKSPTDRERIHLLFRCIHTIKGGAGFAGLDEIKEIAHELENILDKARSEGFVASETFRFLVSGITLLRKMLDEGDYEGRIYRSDWNRLRQQIRKGGRICRVYRIRLSFPEHTFETGTDPLFLLEEMSEKGSILQIEPEWGRIPNLFHLDPHLCYLGWNILFKTEMEEKEIKEVFEFIHEHGAVVEIERAETEEKDKTESPAQAYASKPAVQETIRVEVVKLERILNHVSDLMMVQSLLRERTLDLMERAGRDVDEVEDAFRELETITRMLQEEVMSTSMVPIGNLLVRLQMMAIDLAKELGKEVRVELSGKDTELDRKVIEQITDPLMHIVRNAIDHGIEPMEARVRSGKPATATLRIRAYHQEGHVMIEIGDDGKGIDPQQVLAKAKAKGLVDEHRTLSLQEIYQFLFIPGFSTAEHVTDISGRGVGLDVVMTNVRNLHGHIEVQSEVGVGTTFRIKLPLTMAIIDGMLVRVGEEFYVFPLPAITEFIKAKHYSVHTVTGSGKVIRVRENWIPLAALSDIVGVPSRFSRPEDGVLVVLRDGERKLAVAVDEIVNQKQFVVKSVQENLGHARGVTGATVLGDGSVAIIPEISYLFEVASARSGFQAGDSDGC